jgi:predicted PurR-regulated permease PerM
MDRAVRQFVQPSLWMNNALEDFVDKEHPVPRVISFFVLLAIVLLIGVKFFQVMVLFIVPLFLAAVLVVIFKPVNLWILERVGRRRRLAAVLTTGMIVLIVLLPTLALAVRAVSEGMELYSPYARAAAAEAAADATEQEEVGGEIEGENKKDALDGFISQVVAELNKLLVRFNLPEMKDADVNAKVRANLVSMVTPLAVGGLQILTGTLVGLAIMVISTYYFFADGPYMLIALMRMSPLDDAYERELLEKFSDISRSVVVATLLSAVVQGLLAGVGFYFAGLEKIFFLSGVTVFLAMIPFVGAAAIWIPVCAWLYFHDRHTAAFVLAAYCGGVVSMVDNIIKPYILHGQANLHPLLALLSVIGGVQVLGPIGILVGPMLVAFLQALVNMLNKEIQQMGSELPSALQPATEATEPPSTIQPAVPAPSKQP